jgi:hypothetical protein
MPWAPAPAFSSNININMESLPKESKVQNHL